MDKWIDFVAYAIIVAVAAGGFGTVLAHLVCGIYGYAKFGRPNWGIILIGAVLWNIAAFFELFLAASVASWLVMQLKEYHATERNSISLTLSSVLLLILAVAVLCLQFWFNRRLMRRRGWVSGHPRL